MQEPAGFAPRSHSVVEALDQIRQILEKFVDQDLEKNKLLVKNYFNAIDAGDSAELDRYIAPDYVDHSPQFPNLPTGIEGIREAFKVALKAWEGVHHEIVDQIAEGDKVVTRMHAYANHVGEFLGVPATHKKITMTGIAVHRIANGKLVEHWSNIDHVGVMAQLGVLPRTGE